MYDWLTIELVLGTLLVTTFTCVGLLGLWAATSLRHWFLRTAAVFAALSPLLLIPAYEPFLLLLTQVIVISIGIVLYRRRARKFQPSPLTQNGATSSRVRYSIRDALLAIVVAAVCVAILVRKPHETWLGWPGYLLTGGAFGLSSLGAAWLVCGQNRRVVRFRVVATAAFLISLTLAYFNNWPNDFGAFKLADLFDWATIYGSILLQYIGYIAVLWLIVVPATIALLAILMVLQHQTTSTSPIRGLVLPTLVILCVLPSVTIWWQLLHPLPIPSVELPSPNGYDDLVAAGKMFNSRILKTVVEPKSTEELAAEVAKYSAAYARGRLGLNREIAVPLWGTKEELIERWNRNIDAFSSFSNFAYALTMESKLARLEERFTDAADVAFDNIRLGFAIAECGLVTDFLTGIALIEMGQADLYMVMDKLSPETCRTLSHRLVDMESGREPLERIIYRDRIYQDNAFGWQGHLIWLVDRVSVDGIETMLERKIYPREMAQARLMYTTLALRAYFLEQGQYPDDLSELTPDYLPALPVDSFDPHQKTLCYRRQAAGFVLYSLGVDGDDDGGRSIGRNEYGRLDWSSDGDFRLDVYFADDEDAETNNP